MWSSSSPKFPSSAHLFSCVLTEVKNNFTKRADTQNNLSTETEERKTWETKDIREDQKSLWWH